jgi:hypothetical protein
MAVRRPGQALPRRSFAIASTTVPSHSSADWIIPQFYGRRRDPTLDAPGNPF